MWVPHDSLQPWSTTGNRSGSFPSHLLHLRLQVQLPNLSPADVSWWFCDGGAFRTDQHGGNHGAGGGFLVGTNTPCIHGHQEDQLLQAPTVGLHLNDKLDWSENKNTLSKKWHSRLLLLRSPRSFGILDHFWSAIPENSAGEATSLPGTKRRWETLCARTGLLESAEEMEDHYAIFHVREPVPPTAPSVKDCSTHVVQRPLLLPAYFCQSTINTFHLECLILTCIYIYKNTHATMTVANTAAL